MKTKWQEKLNGNPIPWLLESNPWTKYKVLTELLNEPDSSSEVIAAKQELINHPQIQDLIKETKDWLPKAPTRNSDPTISYYKLRMLTDFGLTINDPGMKEIFDGRLNRDGSVTTFLLMVCLKNYRLGVKWQDSWHLKYSQKFQN